MLDHIAETSLRVAAEIDKTSVGRLSWRTHSCAAELPIFDLRTGPAKRDKRLSTSELSRSRRRLFSNDLQVVACPAKGARGTVRRRALGPQRWRISGYALSKLPGSHAP